MKRKKTFEEELEQLTAYSENKLYLEIINKDSNKISRNLDAITAPRGYSALIKILGPNHQRKQYWPLPNVIGRSRTKPLEDKLNSIITGYEGFSKKEKELFQDNCLKFLMPPQLINTTRDKVQVLAAFIGGIENLENRYNPPIHKIGEWDYKTINPLILDLKEILKNEKGYTWTSKLND